MNKDRIKGLFMGVGIGDALGMPVETFAAEEIAEKHGRVTEYLIPDGHKWFDGRQAGTTTDDTQLTLTIAEALIEGGLDMDVHSKHHVGAFQKDSSTWGKSTRHAIRTLAAGKHWTESATAKNGLGNGVAMKISPVGAYIFDVRSSREALSEGIDFIRKLNQMTHATSVSFSGALIQAFSVFYCLGLETPENFNPDRYKRMMLKASLTGKLAFPEAILKDDITVRLEGLFSEEYSPERLVKEFRGGCYCYNSIPFTIGFFLRNPFNIESLYDVVSAGGDTDSNGSMLGGLLGALHGMSIFPNHLVEGLAEKNRILDTADRFAEKFGFVD